MDRPSSPSHIRRRLSAISISTADDDDEQPLIAAYVASRSESKPDWYSFFNTVLQLFTVQRLFISCLVAISFTAILRIRHPATPSQVISSLQVHERQPIATILNANAHALREPTTLIFHWNISSGQRAPDGVTKEVYLVNDAFPGPTIEARSGDRLVVHVHNSLGQEGVSLHWHGLHMRGYNSMDGAVGFTQSPIPAGSDFTYDFRIGEEEHGTFWWHAHVGTQRADGLFGGLVVHEPQASLAGDSMDVLLLIGDWFHRRHGDVLAWYSDAGSFGNEPVPDSLLVNGQGRYDCLMAVPARPVQCTRIDEDALSIFPTVNAPRKIKMRLVNTGTIAGFNISMDGAKLHPIRVDGGGLLLKGTPVDSMGILYPGERVDVVAEWYGLMAGGARLNIHLDHENFNYPNPALSPNQSFRLTRGGGGSLTPNGTFPPEVVYDLATGRSPPNVVSMPETADQVLMFYVKSQKLARFSNRPVGFINHTTWEPQAPPLISLPRLDWDSHQLVPFIPIRGLGRPVRVDIVINNLDDGSHPFHLHGNSFYVISSFRSADRGGGWGSYNPYTTPGQLHGPPGGLNLFDPLLKDTVSIPRRGHVILSMVTENIGLWMFHCHMMVHLGTGMAFGLHIGVDGSEGHEVLTSGQFQA